MTEVRNEPATAAPASAARELPAEARRLLAVADSVYFLMFPGWHEELRANRWHFAVRWARHKPVVLVHPAVVRGETHSAPDGRIPNCRVLNVQLASEPDTLAKRVIQSGQLLEDMRRHGHERPLLWCYNPDLVHLFAGIPAVARLYHASENYFEMPGPGPEFQRRLEATIAISDLTVAVSSGVADGLRRHAGGAPLVTVTNGCDFLHYSQGRPDESLVAEGHAFERIAVYAGNVNPRIDFDLLRRLATLHPEVLFAFYGPVKDLGPADSAAWDGFTRLKNVVAPGPVDPDRIRNLYAAADVGVIPYRKEPWLIENGLPLKALEMAATGLPAVSTLMKPLAGMTRGITVASGDDEFLAAFAQTSRASLASDVAAELVAVSRANDYDTKFAEILSALAARVAPARDSACTRLDRMVEVLGPGYAAEQIEFGRSLARPLAKRVGAWSVDQFARLFPASVRLAIGRTRLRKALRSHLEK